MIGRTNAGGSGLDLDYINEMKTASITIESNNSGRGARARFETFASVSFSNDSEWIKITNARIRTDYGKGLGISAGGAGIFGGGNMNDQFVNVNGQTSVGAEAYYDRDGDRVSDDYSDFGEMANIGIYSESHLGSLTITGGARSGDGLGVDINSSVSATIDNHGGLYNRIRFNGSNASCWCAGVANPSSGQEIDVSGMSTISISASRKISTSDGNYSDFSNSMSISVTLI